MKTIRHCVYETNSSSCHTVTIGQNVASDMPDITIECRGTGEYGWEQRRYDTPEELLDYAMVAFAYICESEDELKERMQAISDCFARHGVTVDWCENESGTDHIYWDENENDHWTKCTNGYIDHQSAPESDYDCCAVAGMVANDADALYNFVFGGDSYVFTDNDNH